MVCKPGITHLAIYAPPEATNISAEELPHGVNEFEPTGLVKLPSRKVKPARVGGRCISPGTASPP